MRHFKKAGPFWFCRYVFLRDMLSELIHLWLLLWQANTSFDKTVFYKIASISVTTILHILSFCLKHRKTLAAPSSSAMVDPIVQWLNISSIIMNLKAFYLIRQDELWHFYTGDSLIVEIIDWHWNYSKIIRVMKLDVAEVSGTGSIWLKVWCKPLDAGNICFSGLYGSVRIWFCRLRNSKVHRFR